MRKANCSLCGELTTPEDRLAHGIDDEAGSISILPNPPPHPRWELTMAPMPPADFVKRAGGFPTGGVATREPPISSELSYALPATRRGDKCGS